MNNSTESEIPKDKLRAIKRSARKAERYSAEFDAATGQFLREKLWSLLQNDAESDECSELLKAVLEIRKVEVSEARSPKRRRKSNREKEREVEKLFGSLPPVTVFPLNSPESPGNPTT